MAHFSTNLAYLALGMAVNLLLNDEDTIDGFLDQHQNAFRSYAKASPPVMLSSGRVRHDTGTAPNQPYSSGSPCSIISKPLGLQTLRSCYLAGPESPIV